MASYFVGKLLERASRINSNSQAASGNTGSYGPPAHQYGQGIPPGNPSFNPYAPYQGSYGQPNLPLNYQTVHQSSNSPYGSNSTAPNPQNTRIEEYRPPQSQMRESLGQSFWGTLITSQKTASPTLVTYITSLYNHLDQNVVPTRQGGLSPEKIGLLGDLQGYYGDAGLYGYLKTAASHSGQGAAFIDAQFTIVLQQLFLALYDATAAAAFLGSFLTPQASSTPLLTLDGLLTWTVLNMLRQPQQEWICMSKLLSAVQLVHSETGMLLPRSIGRECFAERGDGNAVRTQAMCEENIRRRNEGDARNLNMAARNSDILSAKMRDGAVWGTERDGHVSYWL